MKKIIFIALAAIAMTNVAFACSNCAAHKAKKSHEKVVEKKEIAAPAPAADTAKSE